jgi:MOSC domain-containing protein YiiM
MSYRTAEELEAGMATVLDAPREEGPVRLVVRRPGKGLREILAEGRLDTEVGLVGDDWINRPGMKTGKPDRYAQVTVMNARFAELISDDPEPGSWAQCGDQLYVDLDVSEANLPVGTRIEVGEALLEVNAEPHTGCAQFREWWGSDALRLVNGERYRHLRLRGINTTVVRSGQVRPGDVARKAQAQPATATT